MLGSTAGSVAKGDIVEYTAPDPALKRFNCPHCNAVAQMTGMQVLFRDMPSGNVLPLHAVRWRTCEACDRPLIWLSDVLIYPLVKTAPPPNADLPVDVKRDYEEARDVAGRSPRAAAALLRLAVDKLTKDLEGGKYSTLDINKRIGAMVADGLHPSTQQMLDSVRVIGNNAVHPGDLDLDADATLVASLFWLLNEICDERVTKPKQRAAIYAGLPQSKLDQIAKRDGQATPTT